MDFRGLILFLLVLFFFSEEGGAVNRRCKTYILESVAASPQEVLEALGASPEIAQNIQIQIPDFAEKIINWKGRRPGRPYWPQNYKEEGMSPNSFITLYRGVTREGVEIDPSKAGYWWTENVETAQIMGRHNDIDARVLIFEIQVPLFVVQKGEKNSYPVIQEEDIPDFTPFIRRIGFAGRAVIDPPIRWQRFKGSI